MTVSLLERPRELESYISGGYEGAMQAEVVDGQTLDQLLVARGDTAFTTVMDGPNIVARPLPQAARSLAWAIAQSGPRVPGQA